VPTAVLARDEPGAGREQQHDARREQPLPGPLDTAQRVVELFDRTRTPHPMVAEQGIENRPTEQHHADQVREHQGIVAHHRDSGTRAADIFDGAGGVHSAAWKGASSGSTAAGAGAAASAGTRRANRRSNAASGDSGAAGLVDVRTPSTSTCDDSAPAGAATAAETAARRETANRAFLMMVPRGSLWRRVASRRCGLGHAANGTIREPTDR